MRKNNTREKTRTRHTGKKRTHKLKDRGVVTRANEVITQSRRREGVTTTMEVMKDKKYKRYCDEYNATHTLKTHNTEGGWRQPRRYASGKSQWERWAEEELSQKDTAIEDIGKRGVTARHSTAIILYDKTRGEAGAYAGRAHHTENGTHITIIGMPGLRIPAHRTRTDEWGFAVTVDGETMTMEELARTAMQHGAEIYTLE